MTNSINEVIINGIQFNIVAEKKEYFKVAQV
jgi:hypothetical protein